MRTHVKALKYFILIFTFILLGILLVYTQPQKDLIPLLQDKYTQETIEDEQTDSQIIAESLKDTTAKDVQQTVMNSPNYLGEDLNQKLWNLKATKAVQTGDVSNGFTDLFNVIANTLSIKDSKVDYIADKGRFLPKDEKIILTGNVRIKSETLQLDTQELEYNLKSAYAESNTQVDIKADFGNIIADSMQSFDNADRLVLTGNVRAKFYRQKK